MNWSHEYATRALQAHYERYGPTPPAIIPHGYEHPRWAQKLKAEWLFAEWLRLNVGS